MLFSPCNLLSYSEETLQKELSSQGMTEVQRIFKKMGDSLVLTQMVIIILDREELPGNTMAAWYAKDVLHYIKAQTFLQISEVRTNLKIHSESCIT